MHADFLSRVHDARARYVAKTGDYPEQLFLGPKEYMEFKEFVAGYALFQRTDGMTNSELSGMTIIGLMSDGMRVGRTVE
jgi:hypothetical protein